MSTEETTTEETKIPAEETAAPVAEVATPADETQAPVAPSATAPQARSFSPSSRPPRRDAPGAGSRSGGPGGARGGSRGPGRGGFERPRPEFDQKILSIRRVTRVVAGGRRMSFAVSMVIGDKKGLVGVGTGKAGDTPLAIAKAIRSARKNMIRVPIEKSGSIKHTVSAKYGSSHLNIMPNKGKGMVAGSAVRDILHLTGLHNTTAKIHSGSKNKLNIARATIDALLQVGSKHAITATAVPQPSAEVAK